MAGWVHPPGLLRCGGPSHLLGAHSLGLLSRLLGKESTGVKLCTQLTQQLGHRNSSTGSANTGLYLKAPHLYLSPQAGDLLCSPFYQKSPSDRNRRNPSGKGRLSAS